MTKILIVNNAEPGITEFAAAIEKIISECAASSVFIEYKNCINFNDFDGVILTGSPQGDDIVEHHLPYFRWVKDFRKPLFGICAGHHVTGVVYGATLLRSEEPEAGDFEIKIVKSDPLFKNLPHSFMAKQMHNDSITVPNNFDLLATSSTCRNQLMKHKQKPLYTCQFHPEFYNPDLLRNFLALCQ